MAALRLSEPRITSDGLTAAQADEVLALVEAARGIVATDSFQLLETLASAVARSVYAWEQVTRVTATVHKPAAAASMTVDDVAAEATIP